MVEDEQEGRLVALLGHRQDVVQLHIRVDIHFQRHALMIHALLRQPVKEALFEDAQRHPGGLRGGDDVAHDAGRGEGILVAFDPQPIEPSPGGG